jgi:hypothetical protein
MTARPPGCVRSPYKSLVDNDTLSMDDAGRDIGRGSFLMSNFGSADFRENDGAGEGERIIFYIVDGDSSILRRWVRSELSSELSSHR